jgi:hypothetical protein
MTDLVAICVATLLFLVSCYVRSDKRYLYSVYGFEGVKTEKTLPLKPAEHYNVNFASVLKSWLAQHCSMVICFIRKAYAACFVVTFQKPETKLREKSA